jgi:hypothetical protein
MSYISGLLRIIDRTLLKSLFVSNTFYIYVERRSLRDFVKLMRIRFNPELAIPDTNALH